MEWNGINPANGHAHKSMRELPKTVIFLIYISHDTDVVSCFMFNNIFFSLKHIKPQPNWTSHPFNCLSGLIKDIWLALHGYS